MGFIKNAAKKAVKEKVQKTKDSVNVKKQFNKKVEDVKDSVNVKKHFNQKVEETKYSFNAKAQFDDWIADPKSDVGQRVDAKKAKAKEERSKAKAEAEAEAELENTSENLDEVLGDDNVIGKVIGVLIVIGFAVAYWYVAVPLAVLYFWAKSKGH